jgi:RNA polymerase sigma-70 factor (ECF subfamily)
MWRRDPLAAPGPLLDRVYAYVAYRLGPGALAEDVAADAFERAVRYRTTYDPSLGTPEAWIIGIARRCIADHVGGTPEAAVPAETNGSSNGFEDDAIERLALADAVARLSERDRELVALRYGADLDSKAIAILLDASPGSVDVAVHRALSRLRSLLAAEDV